MHSADRFRTIFRFSHSLSIKVIFLLTNQIYTLTKPCLSKRVVNDSTTTTALRRIESPISSIIWICPHIQSTDTLTICIIPPSLSGTGFNQSRHNRTICGHDVLWLLFAYRIRLTRTFGPFGPSQARAKLERA